MGASRLMNDGKELPTGPCRASSLEHHFTFYEHSVALAALLLHLRSIAQALGQALGQKSRFKMVPGRS